MCNTLYYCIITSLGAYSECCTGNPHACLSFRNEGPVQFRDKTNIIGLPSDFVFSPSSLSLVFFLYFSNIVYSVLINMIGIMYLLIKACE